MEGVQSMGDTQYGDVSGGLRWTRSEGQRCVEVDASWRGRGHRLEGCILKVEGKERKQ